MGAMAPATSPAPSPHGTLIDMPGKGTRNRTVRVDDDLWDRSGEVLRQAGGDRALVFKLALRWCVDHPDEVAALLARPDVHHFEGAPIDLDDEAIVEHAIQMSGGGMHVRCDDPEIERIYPLAEWIGHQQRFGGKVYRRRIIVVEDWRQVATAERADSPE